MKKTVHKIKMIKITDILPNPYQVRRYFEGKPLMDLAKSIRENGVIVPIIARGATNGYEVICGQRRVRAAAVAGLTEVPAVIVKAGDLQCAELSMLENIQRKNLTPIEEAEGYFNLLSYHKLKKEALIKKISVDSAYISEKIKLLSMNEAIRYKAEESNMPEKYMLELLKIHDEKKQRELIKRYKEEDITYTELCEAVYKENEMIIRKEKPKEVKKRPHRMPIYKNTVYKAVEMLKNYCANIETEEEENEKVYEIKVRIYK